MCLNIQWEFNRGDIQIFCVFNDHLTIDMYFLYVQIHVYIDMDIYIYCTGNLQE